MKVTLEKVRDVGLGLGFRVEQWAVIRWMLEAISAANGGHGKLISLVS